MSFLSKNYEQTSLFKNAFSSDDQGCHYGYKIGKKLLIVTRNVTEFDCVKLKVNKEHVILVDHKGRMRKLADGAIAVRVLDDKELTELEEQKIFGKAKRIFLSKKLLELFK